MQVVIVGMDMNSHWALLLNDGMQIFHLTLSWYNAAREDRSRFITPLIGFT